MIIVEAHECFNFSGRRILQVFLKAADLSKKNPSPFLSVIDFL